MATTFLWFFDTPTGDFSDPTNRFAVTSGDVGSNGTAPNGPIAEAELFTVAGTPVALTVTTALLGSASVAETGPRDLTYALR
jgi:hypothetical protein